MSYLGWHVLKKVKWLIASVILLPIVIVMLPFTVMGNWLGELFYRWRA